VANRCRHHPSSGTETLSRREMILRAGCGFGAWALLDLVKRDGLRAASPSRLNGGENGQHRAGEEYHTRFTG
jgi:hypothetical protein